ncbi:acyl carrier protein [Caldalkalibacillus salinus]|uniref:acyl carrier protein n=1 Tax=Caldalkalibacillus salinus TaxID=2803787 RepID=UPI0019227B52|nr:acyl carrier protein [Caldalkalibacillus salinus]
MEKKAILRDIVAEVIEIDDFEDHSRFGEDYGVDSMMVLELVASIEKEFKMTIPEEYYPKFQTFADVVQIVEELSTERV